MCSALRRSCQLSVVREKQKIQPDRGRDWSVASQASAEKRGANPSASSGQALGQPAAKRDPSTAFAALTPLRMTKQLSVVGGQLSKNRGQLSVTGKNILPTRRCG